MAKFRHYLFGHYFIIRTNQRSLKHITDQIIQTPEQESLLPKLLDFNFSIEYKPGPTNQVADALSWSFYMALSNPQANLLNDIKGVVASSPTMQQLIQQFQYDPASMPQHKLRNGLLFLRHRVIIPIEARELITRILHEFHSSPIGGHAGFHRTHARLATYFFWHDMRTDIYEFIKTCQICQRAKTYQTHPAGLLQPLLVLTQVWEDVAMDFITGLPLSNGYSVILVVVDRLSKFAHFASLRSYFTTQQVAEVFLQNVVKLHGIPTSIVSDRDKTFTSSLW